MYVLLNTFLDCFENFNHSFSDLDSHKKVNFKVVRECIPLFIIVFNKCTKGSKFL